MNSPKSIGAVFIEIVTSNLNIPHWWLAEQGFNIETNDPETIVSTDHDHDGYTTGQEYILGTSPTNSFSALRAVLTPPSLNFGTVTGRLYSVEYYTNLVSNGWKTLTNNLPGTGSPLEITDPENAPLRFYRVKVQLAE